ncbi:signal peptidase I [Chengkuizengella sediminis]|uniref:signal peptidase I n=1 Tax=Chengkuizengella sediminis TaxID=1885917 RepID=UPI00138A49DE|nr:signal peptidase I [Chengkuizengella sediminis]NDI35921.1 signal peptidase I [Chengkuizengella sediminis]
MKWFTRIATFIIGMLTLFFLISAIGSTLLQQPILSTVIRSNSMYPLMERGDMVVVNKLASEDEIHVGDVVIFKTENGTYATKGWIIHRIVGGDAVTGYITKGDNNKRTDQAEGGTGPIEREWIVSRTVNVSEHPIVIPYIGFLPVWAEQFEVQSSTMQLIAVGIVVYLILSLIFGEKRRKRKKKEKDLDLPLMYMFAGLFISMMMMITMLLASSPIKLNYNVSEDSNGILMGSSVGVLMKGTEHQQKLVDLNNGGFFTFVASISTKDKQIIPSHTSFYLKPGEKVKTSAIIQANTTGKYNSKINVGLFYPFLPKEMIQILANISYWLALSVVSLIPGLPFMVYPLVQSRLRRKLIRGFKFMWNRFKQKLVFTS